MPGMGHDHSLGNLGEHLVQAAVSGGGLIADGHFAGKRLQSFHDAGPRTANRLPIDTLAVT
ncbi:MAG: hypothetical protein DWQ31_10120, partial [Planctomycetota bacterium]